MSIPVYMTIHRPVPLTTSALALLLQSSKHATLGVAGPLWLCNGHGLSSTYYHAVPRQPLDAGQPISRCCPYSYYQCKQPEDFCQVRDIVLFVAEIVMRVDISMKMGIQLLLSRTQAKIACRLSCNRNGAGSLVMMPIGVPKVAYRVPGAGSADWVDIYNRLYRERIIFLGQEIDDDYANQIIGVLLVRTLPFSGTPLFCLVLLVDSACIPCTFCTLPFHSIS